MFLFMEYGGEPKLDDICKKYEEKNLGTHPGGPVLLWDFTVTLLQLQREQIKQIKITISY